jgi:hypothetical protein
MTSKKQPSIESQIKSQIEALFQYDFIGDLGKLLLLAKKEGVGRYEEIREFILDKGLTYGEVAALVLVAEGKLDRHFMLKVNSKILKKLITLSQQDQARLLSSEKFELLTIDGKISLTWEEMNMKQKDQLLGKGCIHPTNKQTPPKK